MEDLIEIGVIVKPQGIRGELKVHPLTDNVNRFSKLKKVIIDGVTHTVVGVKIVPDSVFVLLSDISDRNTAELFRGKSLFVLREDAVKPKKDAFYIADIEGSTVLFEDKSVLGKVIEVVKSRNDYFTVKTEDKKIVRFPFLKDLLISFDIGSKTIIINKSRFNEVACYED